MKILAIPPSFRIIRCNLTLLFSFALNEDAMATEKTAQGIRAFSADVVKLEALVREIGA